MNGKMAAPYIPKKFRNANSNNNYKNLKGGLFLEEFYKTQNKKNPSSKKLLAENADIELWDQDILWIKFFRLYL